MRLLTLKKSVYCRVIVLPSATLSKKEIFVILWHMDHTKEFQWEHYTPSPQMADKLATNRMGKLTKSQRLPVTIAALFTGCGLSGALIFTIFVVWGFVRTGDASGIFGWVMICFTSFSIVFLVLVLWVNASMFVPEALKETPVRWERGKLQIKMASRDRRELPFSYIIGTYSFAPFVVPIEIPMEKGREYIVYYTARSRLLLSIAPTDQPESKKWLPKKRKS